VLWGRAGRHPARTRHRRRPYLYGFKRDPMPRGGAQNDPGRNVTLEELRTMHHNPRPTCLVTRAGRSRGAPHGRAPQKTSDGPSSHNPTTRAFAGTGGPAPCGGGLVERTAASYTGQTATNTSRAQTRRPLTKVKALPTSAPIPVTGGQPANRAARGWKPKPEAAGHRK